MRPNLQETFAEILMENFIFLWHVKQKEDMIKSNNLNRNLSKGTSFSYTHSIT